MSETFTAKPDFEEVEAAKCLHCGTPCSENPVSENGQVFCCQGCSKVYALLHQEGLEAFYRLKEGEPHQPVIFNNENAYELLSQEAISNQILDHRQGSLCRVTFRIPSIHCTGCVWLLENLYSLVDGIGRTEVDILRKEARINFDDSIISLTALAQQLDQLGYAPDISLASIDKKTNSKDPDRLLLKIGIAGFAFGNIMLFSFPTYLGMEVTQASPLSSLFSTLSFILSLPVLVFSSSEFWKNSWNGLKQRRLNIDLPIVLGLSALFLQSLYDLISGLGSGYLDSLCGLVFFLLIGKWYQRRTTDALSFDRDYRSYFPLMARRLEAEKEQVLPINDLIIGDRIRIRNHELIPADCILLKGAAMIDYSFVTGESAPQLHHSGDHLYAGGRQCGTALDVEIIKPVSQSYLTSLWNHAAFKKENSRLSITETASHYFTPVVIILALATATYWLRQNPSAALTSMVAVLIVACPCALALSAPFAFGQAMRILGRRHFYLRSTDVVDQMAHVTHLLFDKTGTLTEKGASQMSYSTEHFSEEKLSWIKTASSQSMHPLSKELTASLEDIPSSNKLTEFSEVSGKGLSAIVEGHKIHLGSKPWMQELNIHSLKDDSSDKHSVYIAIDGTYVGAFTFCSKQRVGIQSIFKKLSTKYKLSLLTGDHAEGTRALESLFPFCDEVLVSQTPHNKLDAVTRLQQKGEQSIAMIGDGLNDAGALRQSDVGISLTDDVQAFVPACDAILDAKALSDLPNFLLFTKATRRVVQFSFALSICYNLAGFAFAASNRLTPITAAILMPLSSITIVVFATLATRWAARRTGVLA